MKQKRPVNLNIFEIRLPLPGLVSILHRLSGIALFFIIPLMLWLLGRSLASYSSFNELTTLLATPLCKLTFFFVIVTFVYHLTAGIRHLIMDCGWGESLAAGRFSAGVVLGVNIIVALALGVRLW